jgi:hypothetical protein
VAGLDPNAIHVINGDSAAGTLNQALATTNRLIVSRDILSCGPVVAFQDLETWKQTRFGFWREAVAHGPPVDLRPAQNGIWENQARLKNVSKIYAWAATGNTDQFFVAFLLEMLERVGTDPGKVELVEFLQVPPAGRRLQQMGELDVTQMRMHPAPRVLSMDEWMSYRQAWRALTSTDPGKVTAFDDENPGASGPLRQAIRHVLRRYPARSSGLDFWDWQLLSNVRARGPRADRVVSYAMGEKFDEGDLIGDTYFFWRLQRMAAAELPRPLLTLRGDETSMQGTQVELTPFGAEVLDGRASSWPVNPIDYWAGGVHVSSAAGNTWFNDGGKISHD